MKKVHLGDDGKSFHKIGAERDWKDSPFFETVGEVDELSSWIGFLVNIIPKYKKEFDYWLNQGNILFRNTKWEDPKSWTICEHGIVFTEKYNVNTLDIIINDEYVELRKKVCELENELRLLRRQIHYD